ncbi:MAG: pilJ [Betaproteobacteria bacterium]|nr:pilJ [Betaproteobacteria bacterium]
MALSIKLPARGKDKGAKSKAKSGDAPKAEVAAGQQTVGGAPVGGGGGTRVPLIGHQPIGRQYVLLALVLLAIAVGLAAVIGSYVYLANQLTNGVAVTGDALMHSQRLAKAVPNAIAGNQVAFRQLSESRDKVVTNLKSLSGEGDNAVATPSSVQPLLNGVKTEWEKTLKNSTVVIDQEKNLLLLGNSIRAINANNPQLLELAEQISALKLQANAGPRELSVAGQLVMLTQRMAKNANALLAGESIDPEVAFLLGKDTNTFRDLLQGLIKGSDALRLQPTTDQDTKDRLAELEKAFAGYQTAVAGILGNMQRLVNAKQSAQNVFADNEALKDKLSGLANAYQTASGELRIYFVGIAVLVALALITAYFLFQVYRVDQQQREIEADRRREEAVKLEAEAKKVNDQNQAAILRLMNELAEVADGDLTVQATVTEDITGAIADSVNFTIEELRNVVLRINQATAQVSTASEAAQRTSAQLLAAQDKQSNEIRQTGESVLRMAQDINQVSSGARQSADVARQSLSAAEKGMGAVQNSIAGMNEIREQIQETSKRIKRLGESSQEIGEIVELISDITEQTNVLALNAAIQAASAGEAGRGFTVVAEEVQRLAERSGEATKQIGAIVKTIQTDTQDAVSAMEKSTQGVVEGAKLSDAAGQALGEIGQVSRRLAELIEGISKTTSTQAESAAVVAKNIQDILNISEQTSKGTRQNADSVRQLAALAQELKQSVSGFKVA